MRVRDARLPLVALVSWLTILLAIFHPAVALAVLAVAGLAIAAVLARGLWSTYRTTLTALWVMAALALMVTSAHHTLRTPDVLVEPEAGSSQHLVVVTDRTIAEGERFVGVRILEANNTPVARVSATLFFEPSSQRLAPGTTLEVVGDIVPAGRMDVHAWRIFASEMSIHTSAPPLLAGADAMREAFLERSLGLGGDGGALLPGLALGDTQGISASLEADMRAAALAHLVAVSGANCALVVGIAVAITALLGGGVRSRFVVGVVTLVGFVILVTPEPSVVRAAVMATIALAAVVWGRPSAGLAVLALTVWILLLANPWRAVEFAFALSVAATAGIVLGLEPAAHALSRVMPQWLAWFVGLPLVAQLAVQPIIILLRPTLPTYGIPANLLAAPFVPLVTVSGLVGSVSEPVAPAVSELAARIGWWPSTAIAAIARAVSLAPMTELPWISGAVGVAAATAVSAAVWWAMRQRRPGWGLLGAAGIVAVVSGSVIAPPLVTRLAVPHQWQIAQCDVGQGDAVVVRSAERVMVIDTGDNERLLRDCLTVLGLSQIDLLLLTHFDRDHVGQTGVFHGRVGTVLTGPVDNDDDRRRLSDLRSAGADIRSVWAGDRVRFGDHLLHIIWPTRQPLGAPGNDSSVVVWAEPLKPTGLSLLALGDLGERTQTMLRERLPERSVDVLKVSHHGSASQSDALYRDVHAPIALIGVGADNDYGHPAPSLLSLLESLGTNVLRSDELGTLTLSRDSAGVVQLWSERGR